MPVDIFVRRPSEKEVLSSETRRLFGEISQLSPHNSDGLVVYESATLPQLLNERANNHEVKSLPPIAVWLADFANEDVAQVYFPDAWGKGKTRSLQLDKLMNWNDDHKKIVIDFDRKTFQLKQFILKVRGIDFVAQGRIYPFMHNQQFLLSLFEVLRDDLKNGRERWAESLKQSRADFTQELSTSVEEAPEAIDWFIQNLVQAVPDQQFSVYGIPDEENPDDDTPRIGLFTTLPLTSDTVLALNGVFNRRLVRGLGDKVETYEATYLSQGREVSVSIETFAPLYNHIWRPSNWTFPPKGKFGRAMHDEGMDASEIDFANFMAGSDDHDFGLFIKERPVTLLWRQPNCKPEGIVFDKNLTGSPIGQNS